MKPVGRLSAAAQRSLSAALLLLLIAGAFWTCSAPRPPPPEATVVSGVPWFAPGRDHCGPAALASVLGYWREKGGRGPITREEIDAAIYSSAAGGVLGIDLERYAEKQGFAVERPDGTLNAIRREIDAARPVIVRVDRGISMLHVDHFAVVIGYGPGGLVLLSEGGAAEFIEEEHFLGNWERTGSWMLAIAPRR